LRVINSIKQRKMKKLFSLVICCLCFASAQAQEDKLAQLINEREQLVLEYQYYNQQNSNFWGKKSKNDLLNIVETLKKIINKDTELIGAVKEASIKKIAESSVKNERVDRQALQAMQDQRLINERISALQNQVSALENQIKFKDKKVKELEAEVTESEEERYGKDKVITILIAAVIIFLFYTVILQVKLNKANARPRKQTKKA
jgi:CRISPR/Cas system-associated endoribonuclease Cas2